ncbi:methyltransferase [Ottowia thiooxydans]|uniref:methyltransferase n=1 Tax=Ottowia thiooxydans TaxID=219182 RepID=UPI00041312CF|nr:methyltransferase domain-containing protein [Ottowia thiooxydans]
MSNYSIPNDVLTQELQRIGSLIAKRELQQAALALNDARKRYGGDARIFLLASRLAEQAGNAEGALQSARQAQQAAPGWPVAEMELALLLLRQGKREEALARARRVVELAPDDLSVVRRAAGIAIQADDLQATVAWLRKLVSLKPQEYTFRSLLAKQLLTSGAVEEALAMYNELVQEQPWDTEALSGRARAALTLGQLTQAQQDAEALVQLEPSNKSHQHVLALSRGESPKTLPEEGVKALFDSFAERFDETLWTALEYRVPQKAADILLQAHPDRKFNLLDLGCGTGLVGACLGRIDGYIIGVDLSDEMIRKAAQHGVYERFHNVNILDALRTTPGDHYEAITCCDVLVYVGDPKEVIPNALRILKAGGHFIFSCESATEEEEDIVLRPSERFAHKASAVQRWCEEAGFDEITIEQLPQLRREGGEPLPGFLVTARKSQTVH